MAYRKYTTGQYSSFYTSDVGYFVYPRKYDPATVKMIIGCHGHGANGFQYGSPPLDVHVNALAAAGYIVMGIDHARINAWGDSGAMTAISDAYLTLMAQTGQPTGTKIGVMGWSMGGLTALNWVRRYSQYVSGAWVWNPASDLRFFHDGAGLYTPSYSFAGVTQAPSGYAGEQDVTYPASAATTSTTTIPTTGGVNLSFATGMARDFAVPLAGVSTTIAASVNGSGFTYSGVTGNNTLTGCVSTTGSAIAVTSGNVVSSTYAQQIIGYNPWLDAAAYGTLGVPIVVSQANDDTVVPPMMNLDPTNGFIARANSTNVTSAGTIAGGHVMSISNTPTKPVVDFYKGYLG